MTPNEKTIANFETRIRQMILRFQEMKKENQDLYETLEKSEKDIAELRAKLEQQQNDYQSLKMAKMSFANRSLAPVRSPSVISIILAIFSDW